MKTQYVSVLSFFLFVFALGCSDGTGGDSDTQPACSIGSVGCSCTAGGGCDPGLRCQLSVCTIPGTETESNTDSQILDSGSGAVDTNTGSGAMDSGSGAVDTNTDTGAVDSGSGAVDTNTDTGAVDSGSGAVDTHTGTGTVDSGSGTVDSETGPVDTGTGTGIGDSESGVGDTGTADTDSGDDTDTEPEHVLHIEAECAFGAGTGDCGEVLVGSNSKTYIGDPNSAYSPSLENEDTTVGFISSESWMAYHDIDMTHFTALRMRISAITSYGKLEIYLDSLGGDHIGTLYVPDTDSWENWVEAETAIRKTEGIHTLFVVGGGYNEDSIANVDWLELAYQRYRDSGATPDARAKDLLSRMTLDQKLGQMTQGSTDDVLPWEVTAFHLGSVYCDADSEPSGNFYDVEPTDWAGFVDTYVFESIKTNLQIPVLFGIDGVHGNGKVKGATIFPHNIGLAASGNPEMVKAVGTAVAMELAAVGTYWTFAPAVSVARDERWGGTFESFGEDPAAAVLMASYIEGLQYDGRDFGASVLATAKRFAADGGALWGTGVYENVADRPDEEKIDRGNAVLDDEPLHAIHLAPYATAISQGVGAIMLSNGSVNGVKMHEDKHLITDVLKGEMGFDGIVVSDIDGVYGVSGDSDGERVRNSVNAGVDIFRLSASFQSFIDLLRTEVDAGRVPLTRINDAVHRILRAKFAMGLFEYPYPERQYIDDIRSMGHRILARQAARESMVLLKNKNGFLPLDGTEDVCLTGAGSAGLVKPLAGPYTLGLNETDDSPVGEGILNALVDHLAGTSGIPIAAGDCDVGVRVITEYPNNYADMWADNKNPSASISGTCNGSLGCVVVVLGGRPVNIEEYFNNANTMAVVMAWYPGSEGGEALVDLLYGRNGVNFTGKLPMTWKKDNVDTPVNYCEAGTVQCDDAGEHYSDTDNLPASVLFPIGFGLSY